MDARQSIYDILHCLVSGTSPRIGRHLAYNACFRAGPLGKWTRTGPPLDASFQRLSGRYIKHLTNPYHCERSGQVQPLENRTSTSSTKHLIQPFIRKPARTLRTSKHTPPEMPVSPSFITPAHSGCASVTWNSIVKAYEAHLRLSDRKAQKPQNKSSPFGQQSPGQFHREARCSSAIGIWSIVFLPTLLETEQRTKC